MVFLVTATQDGAEVYSNLGNEIYFHEGVTPTVAFTSSLVALNDSGQSLITSSNSTESDAFTVAGTITIDVGGLTLPGDVELGDLVKDSDGNARTVVLELINSSDAVAFTWEVSVSTTASTGDETAQTGSAPFHGRRYFGLQIDAVSDNLLSSLSDGNYSLKATFDKYGATTAADDPTLTGVVIDKTGPEVESISIADASINAADETAEFTIILSETATLDNTKINIDDGSTDQSLALWGDQVTTSFNDDSTELTVTFNPESGTGSFSLSVAQDAFSDSNSNTNANTATSGSVSYDFDAPSVSTIKLIDGSTDISSNTINKTNQGDDLVLQITFSEAVSSFSESDVSVSTIDGVAAATLGTAEQDTGDAAIWTIPVTLTENLTGTLTFTVLGNSYTDANDNLGASGTDDFALDTSPPAPFQVYLNPDNSDSSNAQFAENDEIDIIVKYDSALTADVEANLADETRYIELSIGENTREATLYSIDGTEAKFKYVVTNADTSTVNEENLGIVVSGSITGGNISGGDGNIASADISSVTQPINLTGKLVDGGSSGSAVDGYVEGAIIYADNDNDGGGAGLTAGDPIAQADATGGFKIYGADGPLVLEGGFDISTNKDFNVRYKAPQLDEGSYSV